MLKRGNLCLLDPENKMKIKANNTITVKISSINKRLFKPSIYNCISLQDNNKKYSVTKDLLLKINKQDLLDRQVIIRLPEEAPCITNKDITLLSFLENNIIKDNNSKLANDIKLLKLKLEYYYSMYNI